MIGTWSILFILFIVFSHSTHPVSTRYSDNSENSNSVINLMFLKPNFLELDNYFILSKLCFPLDHASLVVDIQIIQEFLPDTRSMIIRNSEEKTGFTLDIINKFKKINTLYLMNKEFLGNIVQEFVRTQECM